MKQRRLIGMILIGVGFVIAAATGFYLASAELNIAVAGLAFAILAPLVGVGIYLYTRQDTEIETDSIIRQQRELTDLLRSRGHMTITEAAHALNVPEDAIFDMVQQLMALDVFPGYSDWQNGMLYWQERT